MLEITGLWIKYGYVEAVKGVDMSIKEGSIVALIGANGAGKTSTLMAISGMIPKEAGRILFRGEDITNEKPKHITKRGICHVPEGRHIFPEMSVEENLFMGTFGACTKMSKADIRGHREEMFEFFPRLAERRKQMGGTLSGGEQQMLAIARGLMFNPKLIIFDEPSLGLAPIVIEDVYERIKKLKERGTTILLVEQNATVALEIADWAYVMETGNIVKTGTGQDLIDDPDVKKAYLGI